MISYNNFNENKKYLFFISLLKDNNNVAVVSDAGTPCISDPGYRLVNAANVSGINLISVPGPSSVIASISISGLPTDKFYFEGFLPKKKGRQKRLSYLSNIDGTIILFESPKRLMKTLNDINKILGNRVVSLCKEITKLHEKVVLDYLENIIKQDSLNLKGEYIVLISRKGYKLNE